MTENTSRRRFLKAAAATGALAALNATVLAQGDDEEVILLGGKTLGWQGYRLPGEGGDSGQNGQKNPTLTLQEGTTYTLIWENLDGVGHNFAIQDSQGSNLEVLQPLSVPREVYEEANNTSADQNVSLQISGGNVTGVSTENETDGNQTDGNETGGQETTPKPIGKTEIMAEEGAVQAVQFTASSEMEQYICLVHPNTMAGSVEVESGGDGGGGNNSSG